LLYISSIERWDEICKRVTGNIYKKINYADAVFSVALGTFTTFLSYIPQEGQTWCGKQAALQLGHSET
jgi:hypothetical protein